MKLSTIKDITALVLVIGLISLLGIITVGDFYVAIQEGRPVDENVIELLQMSVTGIVGIVAGYLSGKTKKEEE